MTALRAGVTDQFVAIAAETAYGTPATSGWRVIPAINDDWTPNIQEVGTGAFRPGRQAMVADQTQQVKVGGTGSIETRIPVSGSFLLFRDLLDEWDATLGSVTDADTLRTLSLATNSVGPSAAIVRSFSVMVGRVDQNQARRETIYAGCIITGWSLAGSLGSSVNMTLNIDWRARSERTISSDATYAAPTLIDTPGPYYSWDDLAVTVGGVAIPVCTSLTFEADKALDTELYSLNASELKTVPIRSGVPGYTAAIEGRYDTTLADLRAKWGNDGETGAIVISLTGKVDHKSSGSDAIPAGLEITCADGKVTGSEPVMNLDGLSTATSNIMVVDPYDGTSTAVAIDITGVQTAIN